MKAYWLDGSHEPLSSEYLSTEGVFNSSLPTEPAQYQGALDNLKKEAGYSTQDEIALKPEMPNLDEICAKFVDEHYHDEDEVRFVLDGGGIFDIRSRNDRWMRIEVGKGDLIVVPKDRHHRFFLTDQKMIHCVRLFQDASGWVPHYR